MFEMRVGGGMCRLEYGYLSKCKYFQFEGTPKLMSGPDNV